MQVQFEKWVPMALTDRSEARKLRDKVIDGINIDKQLVDATEAGRGEIITRALEQLLVVNPDSFRFNPTTDSVEYFPEPHYPVSLNQQQLNSDVGRKTFEAVEREAYLDHLI